MESKKFLGILTIPHTMKYFDTDHFRRYLDKNINLREFISNKHKIVVRSIYLDPIKSIKKLQTEIDKAIEYVSIVCMKDISYMEYKEASFVYFLYEEMWDQKIVIEVYI